MRRSTTLNVFFTLALACASSVSAQATHPDFSGTWQLDSAKSQAPTLPATSTLSVTQSDKLLTIEQTSSSAMGSRTTRLVYRIDGSPSKNTFPAPGGASIDFNSNVEWSGQTLVITTTADLSGGFKQVERWTVSDGGKQLVVNGDIAVSGQTATAKMVYTKKS